MSSRIDNAGQVGSPAASPVGSGGFEDVVDGLFAKGGVSPLPAAPTSGGGSFNDVVYGPVRTTANSASVNAAIDLDVRGLLDRGADALSLLSQSWRLYVDAQRTNPRLAANAARVWSSRDPRMEVARAAFLTLHAVADRNGETLRFSEMSPEQVTDIYQSGSGVRFLMPDSTAGLRVTDLAMALDRLASSPVGTAFTFGEGRARADAFVERLRQLGHGLDFGSAAMARRQADLGRPYPAPGVDAGIVARYFGRDDLAPAHVTLPHGERSSLAQEDPVTFALLGAATTMSGDAWDTAQALSFSAAAPNERLIGLLKDVVDRQVAEGATDERIAASIEKARLAGAGDKPTTSYASVDQLILGLIEKDAGVKSAFARLQLDVAQRENAANLALTSDQGRVFIEEFRSATTGPDGYTIDAARQTAYAAARTAPPNGPDGPLDRREFGSVDLTRFGSLAPARGGYRPDAAVSGDGVERYVAAAASEGGDPARGAPLRFEVTSAAFRSGSLAAVRAASTLTDGTRVEIVSRFGTLEPGPEFEVFVDGVRVSQGMRPFAGPMDFYSLNAVGNAVRAAGRQT